MSHSSTAVVVLAAGQGTRMRSDRPKVVHEVLSRPLVHYALEAAHAAGFHGAPIVVVGHGREVVEAAVRPYFPSAVFAVQAEQRGTADAVAAARPYFGDAQRVLILSGDVPGPSHQTLARLAERLDATGAPLALLGFSAANPTGYGRCVHDADGRFVRITEHKDAVQAGLSDVIAETRCNAGIYLVDRALLEHTLDRVESNNAQGELYLTDVVRFAEGRAQLVLVADAGEVEGVNDRVQLAQAEARIRAQRNTALMRSGVTFRDPTRAVVAWGVTVEPDVVLEADVVLSGATRVASGARIGQGCVVTDAVIGPRAELLPYCVITDAEVGEAATVGPFAHLRPGTVLGRKAKVGNFVETKKARLADGAKANHLTYLGDCEVGRDANIGAGTITCNYDGVDKHQTRIGERAFIGSNTELVAPCVVGDDAVVGAGTTLTGDVPAGALALTRADKVVVEGWSYRKGPAARKAAKAAASRH